MKKVMFFALAMVFAISGAGAQNVKSPERGGEQVKNRIETLKSELNLTDEQTAKITEMMVSLGKEMKDIRDNGEGRSEANREKMKAIAKKRHEKMKEILTPEQFTKLKELNRKQMEKRRAMRNENEEKISE